MGIGYDCLQRWWPRRQGLFFFLRNKFTELFNKVYQIHPKFFLWNALCLESMPMIKRYSFLHNVFSVASRISSTYFLLIGSTGKIDDVIAK